MKDRTKVLIDSFFERNTELEVVSADISSALDIWLNTFKNGNKMLLCGNGGSCADCDHIAGELMKGFMLKRKMDEDYINGMKSDFGDKGFRIASKLQGALPVISLNTHSALISAFSNDVDASLIYAQQVIALGNEGDLFIGISTSGNAENVLSAMMVARNKGLRTMALTGRDGGEIARIADISIIAPENETFLIQEKHIKIYHLLCAGVESELFDE